MAKLLRQGSMWYVQWKDRGRVRRISTGMKHNNLKSPPDFAKAVLAKMQLEEREYKHGMEKKEEQRLIPVDEAVDRYLRAIADKRALGKVTQRSIDNINYRVPPLARKLKELGIRYIQDATRENCTRFMVAMLKNYEPSTCVSYAHILSAIWNQYLKHDDKPIEMRNYWHDKAVLPEIPKKERAIISNEDWAIIEEELKQADPKVRFVCMVAHYTGARLMACANILVNDFDHNRHTLILPESKRRRLTIGCCDQLANFLLDWPTSGQRFIEPIKHNGMSDLVSRFFAKLRVKYPGRFVGITHHSFRRTFVTRAFALGIPKAHSMELVGHTQVATHDLYKQQVDSVLVTAAQQIADSWGGHTQTLPSLSVQKCFK